MKYILLLGLLLFQMACSTYQARLSNARELLRDEKPDQAALYLQEFSKELGDDQILYLLDYATSLQVAGEYDGSSKSYLLAAEIAEIQDYHSISKITGSLLWNENVVQYKGESYEKLFINVMLAVNFLMQSDLESALVETRKLNLMLDIYAKKYSKAYHQNPFSHYLAGLIWEADKKYDDAYIDYKKAYSLNQNSKLFEKDLIRASLLSNRTDELKKTSPRQAYKTSFIPKEKSRRGGTYIYARMGS